LSELKLSDRHDLKTNRPHIHWIPK